MGNGVCTTMLASAAERAHHAQDTTTRYGAGSGFLYAGWEAEMQYVCQCDAGYFGPDCSMASCPRGDDPDTLGHTDRTLRITAGSKAWNAVTATRTYESVGLAFFGEVASWAFDATDSEVAAALVALPAVKQARIWRETVASCTAAGGLLPCYRWTAALQWENTALAPELIQDGNPSLSNFVCDATGMAGELAIDTVYSDVVQTGYYRVVACTTGACSNPGAVPSGSATHLAAQFCTLGDSCSALTVAVGSPSSVLAEQPLQAGDATYFIVDNTHTAIKLQLKHTATLAGEYWIVHTHASEHVYTLVPGSAACELEDAEPELSIAAVATPFAGASTETLTFSVTDTGTASAAGKFTVKSSLYAQPVADAAMNSDAGDDIIGSDGIVVHWSHTLGFTQDATWQVRAYTPSISVTHGRSEDLIAAFVTGEPVLQHTFLIRVSVAGLHQDNKVAVWAANGDTNFHAAHTIETSYAAALTAQAGGLTLNLAELPKLEFTYRDPSAAADTVLSVYFSHFRGLPPGSEWAVTVGTNGAATIVRRPTQSVEVQLKELHAIGAFYLTIDTVTPSAAATFSVMRASDGSPPLNADCSPTCRAITIPKYYEATEVTYAEGVLIRFYTDGSTDLDYAVYPGTPVYQVGQRWLLNITDHKNFAVTPVESVTPADGYHAAPSKHSTSSKLSTVYQGGSLLAGSVAHNVAYAKRRFFVTVAAAGDQASSQAAQLVISADGNDGTQLAFQAYADRVTIDANLGGPTMDILPTTKSNVKLVLADDYAYAPGEQWQIDVTYPEDESNTPEGMTLAVISGPTVREHELCAGRGLCDLTTGLCQCFEGYTGTACDEHTGVVLTGNDDPALTVRAVGDRFTSSALVLDWCWGQCLSALHVAAMFTLQSYADQETL